MKEGGKETAPEEEKKEKLATFMGVEEPGWSLRVKQDLISFLSLTQNVFWKQFCRINSDVANIWLM